MAKILMIFPESFTPPADHGAGSRPPPSILLDLDTYLADRRNATTATATSRLGHTIQVSLYAADPPAMSYLCVHCPCSKPDDPAFRYEPRVVGTEGRFVLLWVRFAHAEYSSDDHEYFIYKADPYSPSLESLGRPVASAPLLKKLAVVPLGDRGHYLLAGSIDVRELLIYSSADQTWSMKPLPNACPGGHGLFVDKVISLGDGVVGWVDLRVGVAVCDLLREPLEVRFIPLPEPMPANRARLKEHHPGDPAWRLRDVAFSNGVLKFVEVEHRWIVTTVGQEPPDPSEKAVLLDSDLIMSRKRKVLEDTKPTQVRKRDGWRMVTWRRPAMSSDCWHKGCVIDVDDIAVDGTITSSLRSAILGDGHDDDESFKFRNMWSAFPTLSTNVEDLVYLRTTAKANDPKAWMVALDLGNKTLLTALGAYSCGRHDPCTYNYRLCSLSSYLNMDPEDSSQTTKLKDSADPLKTRQSSAEEISCPHKDKPRGPRARLMLEQKAQEDVDRAMSEHGAESDYKLCSICNPSSPLHGAENDDEEYSSRYSSGLLPPPARRQRNCLSPQVPVPVPPQQNFFGQWSGAVIHPNSHQAVNHPNAHHIPNAHVGAINHYLHDATGLSSCPPPQPPPVPQQNMSHYWNGVSYQQNHPWPPQQQQQQYVAQAQQWNHPWPPHQPQQYVTQAQQWNGVAGGYQVQAQQWNHPWPPHQPQQYVTQVQQWNGVAGGYQVQEQQNPYTHGLNQNHWNAAPAAGYYYSPSANVNLQQNQWSVGYDSSAPNLPSCGMHPAAGQLPNQPAWAP